MKNWKLKQKPSSNAIALHYIREQTQIQLNLPLMMEFCEGGWLDDGGI